MIIMSNIYNSVYCRTSAQPAWHGAGDRDRLQGGTSGPSRPRHFSADKRGARFAMRAGTCFSEDSRALGRSASLNLARFGALCRVARRPRPLCSHGNPPVISAAHFRLRGTSVISRNLLCTPRTAGRSATYGGPCDTATPQHLVAGSAATAPAAIRRSAGRTETPSWRFAIATTRDFSL